MRVNNKQRRCKILLTSRQENVLGREMETNNILVEPLSDEEAVILFENTVGDSVKNPIPSEIAKKCGGLPLVIKTIASRLKGESTHAWEDTLKQLKIWNLGDSSDPFSIYSIIKWSYDLLKDHEAKAVFRLCGLFNAGYSICIDDLLSYSMGLELFKNYTLEERRNRLYKLIGDLQALCLLLDDDVCQRFKMHDIIHSVAMTVASEVGIRNLQCVAEVKDELEDGKYEDSVAICMPCTNISEFPERLTCPKLKLFLLFAEDNSLQIPDDFFEQTKNLKVLDLSCIHFPSLPPSLCCLTNLQTLHLKNCQLRDIGTIGNLTKLEILSFWGSDIKLLPVEIGKLTRLKLLNLGNCSQLQIIAPNVIAGLRRLEELYMNNSFVKWESEGLNNEEQRSINLAELKQLSYITTLMIRIPVAESIPQDLFWGAKLKRFKILIGDEWSWSEKYESSKMLKLKLNNNICLGHGIRMLLKQTEDLYLDELSGVTSVVDRLDGEGFHNLKFLHLQNSPELLYIVSSMADNVFPMLESLILSNLINLEKICCGQLTKVSSFSKLKIIQVEKCHGLKYLFSFSMAINLLQILEIQVTNCMDFEEIVGKENEDCFHKIEFTQLRSLTLEWLPKFRGFSYKVEPPTISQTLVATNMEEIVEEEDPENLLLVGRKPMFPSLENLKLSSIDIEHMFDCTREFAKLTMEGFKNLKLLEVRNCHNLRYIFTPPLVLGLVQLEKMTVERCNMLEEIITKGDNDASATDKITFRVLDTIILQSLPNLGSFCSGTNMLEFPSLRSITMSKCPKIATYVSNHKNLLNRAIPLFCNKVELPKLESLIVDGCGSLRYMFSSSIVESLFQLKTLRISFCELMEGFVVADEERISNIRLFPVLHLLELRYLPKLRTFCNFTGDIDRFELSFLSYIHIDNCPNMVTFISNSDCTSFTTINEKQPFFDEKVELPKLESLIVDGCGSLRYMFSSSIVESLFQLKTLRISFCELMEGFVVADEERISNMRLFPVLHLLELRYLPKLRTFCNFTGDIDRFELSFLSYIHIDNCPNMVTFISNFDCTSFTTINEKQPFFDEKVRLPNLEKLKFVGMNNLRKIWQNQLRSESFSKLRDLMVEKCGKLLYIFPCTMLERPEALDTLMIKHCHSLEEILECQGHSCRKMPLQVANRLRELNLFDLPKLKHVWNMDSQAILAYQNLVSIKISYCHSLECLFPANVARDLSKLEVLEIFSCMMTEIVAQAEEAGGLREFGFPLLKSLLLNWLPNLTSFYPGRHISKWPKLKKLILAECNKVEIFASECPQDISIPQPLFMTMKDGFPCLDQLELFCLPKLLRLLETSSELSKVFQNLRTLRVSCCDHLEHLLPPTVDFQTLTTLEVAHCNKLINLMEVSGAKNMLQLTNMDVNCCKMMKEIIGHTKDEEKELIIFRELKYLRLFNLPNLTRFCVGNHDLEFPSFDRGIICQCVKMKNFSQSTFSTSKQQDGQQLTEDQCPMCHRKRLTFLP